MDDLSKKRELQKVPTRKLLAAIKRDIQKSLKPSYSPGKPLKTK